MNEDYAEHVLKAVLSVNGWYPDREVPIEKIVKHLSRLGYNVHEKAKEFFTNFFGIGVSFVSDGTVWRTYANKENPGKSDSLTQDFIGFGVNPSYKFDLFTQPACPMRANEVKKLEMEFGSTICPCGYGYRSYCWIPKKKTLYNLLWNRITPPLLPSMLRILPGFEKGRVDDYYILEDGRILERGKNRAEIVVYRTYKDLILDSYRSCDQYFFDMSDDLLDLEYL